MHAYINIKSLIFYVEAIL